MCVTLLSIQFRVVRKLGGSEMIEAYMSKLESNIQMNFNKLDEENDKKKIDFDVSHTFNSDNLSRK